MKKSPRVKTLTQEFFERDADVVARQLLGKYLVARRGDETVAAVITEVEAYLGPHDLACHGRFGCTPRTEAMFGPAGQWYVYFIYGMYWMLNVVTGPIGFPAAVLIRGAGEWNGPGKLTRALAVDKRYNALPANETTGLWIEDRGRRVRSEQVSTTPRIGIDYAGEWKDLPLRFVLR